MANPPTLHTHSHLSLRDIGGSIGEEEEEATPLVMPSWVEGLVTANESIFAPLEGIPPDGRIKHTIELVEGAKPVMKRPYRLIGSTAPTRQ